MRKNEPVENLNKYRAINNMNKVFEYGEHG